MFKVRKKIVLFLNMYRLKYFKNITGFKFLHYKYLVILCGRFTFKVSVNTFLNKTIVKFKLHKYNGVFVNLYFQGVTLHENILFTYNIFWRKNIKV